MIAVNEASRVAACFKIDQPIEVCDFAGKGNINLDTFLVAAGSERRNYLLQRVNTEVFPMADRVMAGMMASITAQRQSLLSGVINAEIGWKALELVPTHEGTFYHETMNGAPKATWRLIQFIEDTVSYKSLSEVPEAHRLGIAKEVGRGLAIYSDLTASIDPEAVPVSLPGYRNTRLYYSLFKAALDGHRRHESIAGLLPKCPETRASCERHFLCALSEEERIVRKQEPDVQWMIDLALEHEPLALSLQDAVETGEIRRTVIHGDTKIENFLFDNAFGKVISLVDLDTVMPLTWLADWGDMVRSLSNVAGEKETDCSKVQVDSDVYRAVTVGFLSTASTPTEAEIRRMPTAVQVIAMELGVRFLADYLRGDTYFGLGPNDPHDLNKIRAMVQLTLFKKLLEHEAEANDLVEAHLARR
ncbi:MAG: phosphotransferase [Fimbriimonadales bacterium]